MTDVLLRALSERHPDLYGHLRGVAELVEATARRLGVAGEELDYIRLAGELHDVDKMALPDEILARPGPLTEREWDFVRGHTVIGERIIAAAPALAPVARLVRSSHERFDGQGYPDGLRRYRSGRASRSRATRSTRWSRHAPTGPGSASSRRSPSCAGPPAPSSTRWSSKGCATWRSPTTSRR